jgi:hypothetical protein
MPTSHLQLRRLYNRFNRLYFNSELPTDLEIVWSPCDDANGITYTAGCTPFRIEIDPSIQGQVRFTHIVLLHEMVHVHRPRLGHGKRFKAELRRLVALGAYDKLL